MRLWLFLCVCRWVRGYAHAVSGRGKMCFLLLRYMISSVQVCVFVYMMCLCVNLHTHINTSMHVHINAYVHTYIR